MRFATIEHLRRRTVVTAVSEEEAAVLAERFTDVEDVLRAAEDERDTAVRVALSSGMRLSTAGLRERRTECGYPSRAEEDQPGGHDRPAVSDVVVRDACHPQGLAVVTMGGQAWFYGERGIHGDVNELLFPLQHGTLFYAGAKVLPPLLLSGADRFTPRGRRERGQGAARAPARDTDDRADPVPAANGGDYDENLVLRPDAAPGLTGLGVHVA
jgi:hypothetical protein